jgi:ubiquinone/menaquinone biosynthesis C-methylase UbiE
MAEVDATPEWSGNGSLLRRGFQPSVQDDDDVRQMVMLLDLQDGSPSIERLRRWAIDAAAPQAGESVVDVGSGTGTMARRLADMVGGDTVLGIEPNPRLRTIARERLAATGPQVRFVDGLATELPLGTGTVDLLWCERVLQHLQEPAAAVAEFARVLRPGGRAVLLDSDHRTRVTSDVDPEVEAKVLTAFLSTQPNPTAARLIPRQVRDAGLVLDADVGSAALVMPPAVALRSPLLEMTTESAVERGLISRTEADEALQRHRAAAAEGVAFSAVTVFGFVARKPSG